MHVCNKCQNEIISDEIPINIGNKEFHAECIESVPELVKGYFNEIAGVDENDICYAPNIPNEKLSSAIKSYAKDVLESQVLALYDSTIFGGAKEGILITAAGIYFSEINGKPINLLFNDIERIQFDRNKKSKRNGTFEDSPQLRITVKNGIIFLKKESTLLELACLHDFFVDIMRLRDLGKIDETDKIMIVEDMPNDVKLNYARVIVNMTFLDDNKIDDKELSELQILMSRLKFDAELRSIIREYMSKPSIKTADLLQQMDQAAPKGSQHYLHISLLKDLIYVTSKTKGQESIYENLFIIKFAKFFKITKEQIEVLMEACKYDEMIVKGELDDSKMKKYGQNLAAHATAVGLPLAAVYMSGSVVGLSAAGITSGLAGLGLGGIFGLSSMVTGVGVFVLIGVGAYKGVKWIKKASEKKEKFSKRELMIMEIMKIQQNTISNLTEDINTFAIRLLDATKKSKINRTLIDKIGKQLTVFSNAHRVLRERGINLEGILNEAN